MFKSESRGKTEKKGFASDLMLVIIFSACYVQPDAGRKKETESTEKERERERERERSDREESNRKIKRHNKTKFQETIGGWITW